MTNAQSIPKILVGILYSGENEFNHAIQAINCQKDVHVSTFIISHLPNRQAHESLYQNFMARTSDFDYFIKVDADMVLLSPTLFRDISEEFKKNPGLMILRIAVMDFFTAGLIGYLQAYRNNFIWNTRPTHSFQDVEPVKPEATREDWTVLAPAANHAPDPHPFQAFHFGIHKGIKYMDGQRLKIYGKAQEHLNNITKVEKNYRKTRDIRLLYALIGAELAFSNNLTPECIDFTNPITNTLFDTHIRNRESRELVSLYRSLSFKRRLFIPNIIWYFFQRFKNLFFF